MHTSFTTLPANFHTESPRRKIVTTFLAVFVLFAALIICARNWPQWTGYWLVREPFGLLEMGQMVLALGTFLIALRMLATKTVRSDWFLALWTCALGLGAFYIAGEEVSWGQWFVNWNTPEYWQTLNDQGETNLHNISHWFDQKPRALLVAGILISGIIFPWFINYKPHLVMRRFDMLYPPLWLLPIALGLLVSELFQQFDIPFIETELSILRPGEIQELFIYWFLFGYALSLWRRVKLLEGAA